MITICSGCICLLIVHLPKGPKEIIELFLHGRLPLVDRFVSLYWVFACVEQGFWGLGERLAVVVEARFQQRAGTLLEGGGASEGRLAQVCQVINQLLSHRILNSQIAES